MPSTFNRNPYYCSLLLLIVGLFLCIQSFAQSNPSAQPIPYSQDFGSCWFNTLPLGFAAWNSSSSPCSTQAIAAASSGIGDQSIDTTQIDKANGDVYGYARLYDGVQSANGQAYIQTSGHLTQGTCQLVLAISTMGYNTISVGYTIEMINPQIKQTGVVMQYRVGTSGSWTTVNSSYSHSSSSRVQYQIDSYTDLLGPAVNNQPVVQLRWATWHATVPAGNSCGLGIDNITVNGTPASFTPRYARSVASGNWNNPLVWETSSNNLTWTPATSYPTGNDYSIIIRPPHSIITTGITSLHVDELTIDAGATLWNATGTSLVIRNGPGIVDLEINGTFRDSSNIAVIFGNNSSWRMGTSGTIIKTTNSNSHQWPATYYNGISSIPSTSNWIFRKPLGYPFEPHFISAIYNPPYTQVHYGNVYVENFTLTWGSFSNCRLSGTINSPVIKGHLYIGGNGTGQVHFQNINHFTSPMLISGDIHIKTGSSLLNQGTGIHVQGNVNNNGTISYLPFGSVFLFSGSNPQTISGSGTFSAYNFQINKVSNDLTINQQLTIDGTLALTSGKIITSSLYVPILNDNTSVTGASNASFIQGPVTKLGDDAFTFPVGKNGDYQPVGISSGPAKTPFWTETFNNNCLSGCLATSFTGVNGTWTQTLTGTNGSTSNIWYVSGKECGNAAGSCQSICTGDASLHIGTGISPSLDSGATYNSGLPGPMVNAETNKRIQSPVINCAGRFNIIVEFNYIEGGFTILDNAIFQYFNGSSWITCADLSKTTSSSCSSGTTWTNFRMALPSGAFNNPNVRIGFLWVNDADGTGYNPSFAVDDITLTDQSESFTAEYFHSDPQSIYGNTVTMPLHHVSHCEYWNLTHNSGAALKNVTLSFDANSCGINNLPALSVARFQSPAWRDEGKSLLTGTTSAGTLTSNITTGYGPFTLASLTSDNPLPLVLLNFDALYDGRQVNLSWNTASEINNDFFTVQRSKDGSVFEDVEVVDGAGTSIKIMQYSAIDKHPLNGVSYYRLKSTDLNGSYTLSKTVAIRTGKNNFEILTINHSAGEAGMESTVIFPVAGNAQILIIDLLGRTIISKNTSVFAGFNLLRFSDPSLRSGLYFMQVIFNDMKVTKRFTC